MSTLEQHVSMRVGWKLTFTLFVGFRIGIHRWKRLRAVRVLGYFIWSSNHRLPYFWTNLSRPIPQEWDDFLKRNRYDNIWKCHKHILFRGFHFWIRCYQYIESLRDYALIGDESAACIVLQATAKRSIQGFYGPQITKMMRASARRATTHPR